MNYTDVMMPIYNLIEYSNNHLQTSGSFSIKQLHHLLIAYLK